MSLLSGAVREQCTQRAVRRCGVRPDSKSLPSLRAAAYRAKYGACCYEAHRWVSTCASVSACPRSPSVAREARLLGMPTPRLHDSHWLADEQVSSMIFI